MNKYSGTVTADFKGGKWDNGADLIMAWDRLFPSDNLGHIYSFELSCRAGEVVQVQIKRYLLDDDGGIQFDDEKQDVKLETKNCIVTSMGLDMAIKEAVCEGCIKA